MTTNSVCTFDGLARAKCEDAQFADGCVMKVGGVGGVGGWGGGAFVFCSCSDDRFMKG
jgi:hypothetical protein